ncbi:T9SS type A sorting domain-containing protein [Microbulbifer sediminum]|uniref:T9SS type A sorting domain-containing protein n=1 Tax=Microbulbifer sediminum TaxID=2904250 RepID=UPI001F43EA88|nr:T9SS type A sorting domain-containing protein [Microbulbifer sediminum]
MEPEVRDTDQVRYVSGGVGKQERQALDALASSPDGDFDTRIHLSANSGHYLGDAQVEIRDTSGHTVLDTQTEGPLLLVDLPAGTYTVEARNGNRTQGTEIEVAQGGDTTPVYLTWAI